MTTETKKYSPELEQRIQDAIARQKREAAKLGRRPIANTVFANAMTTYIAAVHRVGESVPSDLGVEMVSDRSALIVCDGIGIARVTYDGGVWTVRISNTAPEHEVIFHDDGEGVPVLDEPAEVYEVKRVA